ncbi:MAG: glucose-6-phosphate isomerase, partial [Alphaproteobacteria bacterium]|nr:glucose-6-phosphate isomerase [Alphaproteobacteria bacterium]
MIDMQLADNPITKILNKKLKLKNFENLSELVNKRDRLKNFQFNFEDLIVDITRQSLDEDVRNDLIELAKFANIKEKIQDLV